MQASKRVVLLHHPFFYFPKEHFSPSIHSPR
jgi:hypothetical protein